MSVYIQEVLGLLRRNKKKIKLDKMRDHFEFGKLYNTSKLNTGASYNPTMEPFVVKWGDLVCQATENLTRTQPGSGKKGKVPVYTDPEGTCSWDTLMDSIMTQNIIGDTISIAGNLYVDGTITSTALTDNRVVIVGPGGILEDDANLTMDGVTFTANVDVVHGTDVPAGTPAQTTTINSNLKLEGPVYDSLGNIGGLNKVLVGLADGRVKWQDDDVVEALTYGSLWQGDPTNYKVELPIGTVDQILISDGTTFAWQDNPAAIVGETCAVYRIPLWTPDSNTLGCSLLIQDGNAGTPATKITNDGQLVQTKELFLDTVGQDDTLTQVLVRDPASANVVKWRDALSIVPELGWDDVPVAGGVANWDVVKYNGYMEVNSAPPAFRAIRPNNIVTGDEGYFVFVCERPDVPEDFLKFTGVNGGTATRVRTTWSGDQVNGNPYIPSTASGGFWQQGTAVKFHYILRIDSGGNQIIWWDACCEIKSLNICPVATDTNFTTQEDTAISGLQLPSTDDGTGTLTWSIVTPPPASDGTVTLDPATGQYSFTPAANFFGTGTFTWKTNDTFCDSNIATVTYNVTSVCDVPSFRTYADPCGPVSVAPVYSGSVGGTYLYEGHYCDPDNNYTDVTLTAEYSTDGQTTWNAGLPANFTLVKDQIGGAPAPWRFTFASSNVPAGILAFRLTLKDTDVTCKTEYIFNVTAALDILNKFELQVDNIAGAQGGNARIPYATNDNIGTNGATGGTWQAPAFPNPTGWLGSGTSGGGTGNFVPQGRMLTNMTSEPTNTASTGIAPNTSVLNVTPSGGTYGGLAGGATFQHYYVNKSSVALVYAFADSIPNDNNCEVGQTIIFSAATLNAAFSPSTNFTGDLVYTIAPEDKQFAPLATSAIALVPGVPSDHGCNQGGFKLFATITNSSGATETYLISRASTSNQGGTGIHQFDNRYSLDTVVPSVSFMTFPNGDSWTRVNGNSSLGTNGAPGILHADDIDMSFRGFTRSLANTNWNFAHAYNPTSSQGGVNSNYSTTGVIRLNQTLLNNIAANTADGLVTFRLVGDTWVQATSTSDAIATVTSVDGTGAITGINLISGGSTYLSYQGNANANWNIAGGTGSLAQVRCTMSGVPGGTVVSIDSINTGGKNYTVGDNVTISAANTYVASTHGDNSQLRMFKENAAGTDQVEVFNGAPWNTSGTGTNTAFKAGDGTAVQVDIFNDTVTII